MEMGSLRSSRRWAAILAATVLLAAGTASRGAGPAAGASAGPLGLSDCGPAQGVWQCSGLVTTWDGVPLDTTVTLPSGRARHLPLVAELHGFGNSKYEYLDPASTAYTGNAFSWAKRGYAVLTFTARGLWGSCGTPESRAASPQACAAGYIHLADVRYEARDAQTLIGRLVDEGWARRRSIGVTGDSYGGGQSLMLAALRSRVMLPGGRLVPWRSPDGARLRIAAAAPVIPWSDLVSAAAPNGRVNPVGVTSRRRATHPVGVAKTSFINAIMLAAQNATGPGQPIGEPFVPGRPMGYLAPIGTDPGADVQGWVARTDAGEPYADASARNVVRQMADYHSAYYIRHDRPPAPLLIGSGFTDDLFPVDEALRFANRTRRQFPHSPVALFFGDFGHQRAAQKPAERARLIRAIQRLFAHRLKGRGRPPRGATAYVETCPKSIPSLGPFHARTFRGLARHRVRFASAAPESASSAGGDPSVAAAIDPVTGGGDSCAQTNAGDWQGTARYELLHDSHRPLTMIGAPRIRARLVVQGADPHSAQLDSRLWDVFGGKQTLVARGTYRPEDGVNVWRTHPGAWRFAKGHQAVLELVGADPPYARPSNGAFQITVKHLAATLPVR